MPDIRIGYRPFAEQQAYFRRKVNVPTQRWDDLRHGDHAHGFMVAGVTRQDVLDDIRGAVRAAIDTGETFADFQNRFGQIIERFGWPGGAGNESDARRAWRMRMIYQTNLRTSYMAGRWQQLQTFPYLRYQHNTVTNPREDHQSWDGLVLATDDPWWDEHYPPNGWGCRCSATGVGRGRLRALGKTGPDPTPGPGPGDPPPEWAYHVGKASRSLPAAAALGEKILAPSMPRVWRNIALADARNRSTEWFQDWPALITRVQSEIAAGAARPRGTASPVGFLPAAVVDALQSGRALNGRGFAPLPLRSPLVASTDRALYHALRDAKVATRPELRGDLADALRELPQWMRDADAIAWDPHSANPALLATRHRSGDDWMVLVLRPDYIDTRANEPVRAAWVRTMELRSGTTLRGLPLLFGSVGG